MPSVGFEPTTPATKRPQTYVLDRAATEVGLHRLEIYKEPVCRKGGMGEETASHILFECEALGRIRYSVLGPPGFEVETIYQEPIKTLLDLIRKAGVFDEV
jgi:hypothetical protein